MVKAIDEGFKRLAESVIEVAAKDLNSKNWRDQHSAIVFFGENTPTMEAEQEDWEYFNVVCNLAEIHPDTVIGRLPEFKMLPIPDKRAPGDMRDGVKYRGTGPVQMFDVWANEEFLYSMRGRKPIAQRIGVSESTVDTLINLRTPNLNGIAVVRQGESPIWPQRYSVYKNGKLVGSAYGLNMTSRIMNTRVDRVAECLLSGKPNKGGYQVVKYGEEPRMDRTSNTSRMVKVYKDREVVAVVKNNIHAAQIARVSVSTVASCKARGVMTRGGYSFKAVNE